MKKAIVILAAIVLTMIGLGGNDMDILTLGAAMAYAKDAAKPSAEDIATAVDAWLDDHPEATTTVEDGSITKAKLDSNLQGTVDEVPEIKSALSDCQDELGITPVTPVEPVEVDLSNPETGYYYVASSPANTASWNSADYGLRGVFLNVQEGEKYVINCSLNANNAVYVLFGANDDIKYANNKVYPAVYPAYTSATGNIDFTDVEVTIPANIVKMWIGFKSAKTHSAVKYAAPTPTGEKLSDRVADLETEVAAIDISSIKADDAVFEADLNSDPDPGSSAS